MALSACQPTPPAPTATLTATARPSDTPTPPPTATQTARPSATASPTPSPTPRPTATATPAPPKPAGRAVIGLVGQPASLNPLLSLDPALDALWPMLYPSLLTTNPQTGAFQPGLADLPRIATDGRSVTYTLRAQTAATPADVQASIEAAIWPELDDVRRVSTDSAAGQVVVTLTQPNCALLDALARLPILPQTATPEDVPPASLGPFVIESWDADAGLLKLAANPAAPTAPRLSAIDVQFFPSEETARQALDAGALDVAPLRGPVGAAPAGFSVTSIPGSALTLVAFNNQDPVLQDVLVRQALTLALNRPRIAARTASTARMAAGFLPAGHWAASDAVNAPEFSPQAAANLLVEAGLLDRDGDGWRDTPDGRRWEVALRVDERRADETSLAFEAAADYRQVGVYARAELVPFETLVDDLLTHDYQAAVYSLPMPGTLDYRPWWHSGQIEAEFGLNLTAYSQPSVDEWLTQANRVPACAASERANLYGAIQSQLAADAPADFVLFADTFLVARDTLTGLQAGPFAPFTWNIDQLAVGP